MTRPRPFGRKWNSLPRLISKNAWGLAILTMATAQSCDATGYYGPSVYLDDGGKNVNASPEFYWELEAKRLAQGFTPAEKRVAAPPSADPAARAASRAQPACR